MSRSVSFVKRGAIGIALIGLVSLTLLATAPANRIKHVVLISIDGMHALDLANYVKSHPQSALAVLSKG